MSFSLADRGRAKIGGQGDVSKLERQTAAASRPRMEEDSTHSPHSAASGRVRPRNDYDSDSGEGALRRLFKSARRRCSAASQYTAPTGRHGRTVTSGSNTRECGRCSKCLRTSGCIRYGIRSGGGSGESGADAFTIMRLKGHSTPEALADSPQIPLQ
jgi:hypothetical protein